jgi:hypothetical protein
MFRLLCFLGIMHRNEGAKYANLWSGRHRPDWVEVYDGYGFIDYRCTKCSRRRTVWYM